MLSLIIVLFSFMASAHQYTHDNLGGYVCSEEQCGFKQVITFQNPIISSNDETLILNRLEVMNQTLSKKFIVPSSLTIGSSILSEYNAFYNPPDSFLGEGLAFGAAFILSNPTTVLLPTLTHEYGHALFEKNVIEGLYRQLGFSYSLSIDEKKKLFRQLSGPMNELYADVISHLFDGNKLSEAFREVSEFAKDDESLLKKDRKKIEKAFTKDILECRDYEGQNSRLKPFYLFARKTHLETHLILCPSANYVWNKLQSEPTNNGKIERMHKAFSAYLAEAMKNPETIKNKLKRKHNWNQELIDFLEVHL
ncbi:MAG: hypothetical protein ACOYL6_12950 [Bacteriovoracaceae bacterium]